MKLKEMVFKKVMLAELRKELNHGGLRIGGKFDILARYLEDNK